ncbi:regulatory YrvL family protein [Priestia megaterium]|uniref:YrvL family regulatory protein n=1 Tax=Priestia megaterium TaxID=1404 RepID=UPI001C237702|nr:YrvL family regulatory protein [Priestia megaterium]MBU8688475.1 regulatory YrvL family protein [Priestia megaterium]
MKRTSRGMDGFIAFFIVGAMVLIILAILMGSYFFGFIGFLKVMGVEYESYWAICLFLFFMFVFGSITELFSKALTFLMKNARLNRVLFVTSVAFVEIFFTFLSVYIADLLVSGITVSILAVTLLSVLFFWMESALDSEFLSKKTS